MRLHRQPSARLPRLQFNRSLWRFEKLGKTWVGKALYRVVRLRSVRSMKTSPGKTGRIRYDWWRAHHGLPSHAKWRAVARAAQVPVSVTFHIVVCLLDTASRGNPRGSIGDFKPFDCAGIVDVPVDKVDRVVEVLREIHWIEGHMIAEWDGRQPQREDVHAAKRAAEYRSRIVSVTSDTVTHRKRDGPGSSRIESVTNHKITPANAPDREEDLISSESGAARAQQQNKSATSLATALPTGALARSPPDGAQPKRPCDLTRSEFDAMLASNRGKADAS